MLPDIPKNEYKRLYRIIITFPNIGKLRGNHILAVASIIGIVPLKIYIWVIGRADKTLEMLEKNSNLPERDVAMKNIRYLTEVVTGIPIHYIRGGKMLFVS